MRTIRTRLQILIASIILCGIAGAALLAQNYVKVLRTQSTIENQVYGRSRALAVLLSPYSEEGLLQLQSIKYELTDPQLLQSFSLLISAYTSHNPFLLRQRTEEFNLLARSQYERTQQQLKAHHERLFQIGFLAFGIPIFGLIYVIVYSRRKIFEPLQNLSHRMLDFLDDRYSFKFAIPEDNEIGDMQRTFNSLAQRVLNNFDELKALDHAKSEFLSIASHELRTPMTSIKGSLSLLQSGVMGKLEDSSKRLVVIAEKETDRLIRLINDILDLAKIEARSFNLSKQWIVVESFLEKTLEGILGFAQTAEVQLHLQSLPDPIEMYCDPDRLQQAVTNLVSNAIKFSPQGGHVFVSFTLTKAAELLIEVTDQGHGISPELQHHIFEKFSQASSQENPLVKGTGLGLAISRALVEEHGGRIGVQSAPGEGATFFITLHEWRKPDFSKQPLLTETVGHKKAS